MVDILVSINCITYNHEKYIAQAIESFLMQKTNFKYEILIHDDASIDRTAEIIREYEKKYPDLIKPIYQTENQYSKEGVSVSQINLERAKGKYIARCEGDDYWIDPYKLQKQVDYMEKHPECSLCVHAVNVVSALDNKLKDFRRPNRGNKVFTFEQILEGGGGLFGINSMMYPTEFSKIRPSFLENAPVGDYPLVINLSLLGEVYYLDEFMSAYREGVSGSWSERNFSNPKKIVKHFLEIDEMLDDINLYTNYQYEDAINKRKKNNQLFVLLKQRNFKEAKKGENKGVYKKLDFKRKIIINIDQYIPRIYSFLRNKRRWMRWTMK